MFSEECLVIYQNSEMHLQKLYKDGTQKQRSHNPSNTSMFEQCSLYANTYYYSEVRTGFHLCSKFLLNKSSSIVQLVQ